jgi:hypothetical protein
VTLAYFCRLAAAGFLPSQWGNPKMFPRLQYLHIHTNDHWSATPTLYKENTPWLSPREIRGSLPAAWTRNRVPRSFPQLHALVLYPGNKEVCSLPDPAASGGHADINAGGLGYES